MTELESSTRFFVWPDGKKLHCLFYRVPIASNRRGWFGVVSSRRIHKTTLNSPMYMAIDQTCCKDVVGRMESKIEDMLLKFEFVRLRLFWLSHGGCLDWKKGVQEKAVRNINTPRLVASFFRGIWNQILEKATDTDICSYTLAAQWTTLWH